MAIGQLVRLLVQRWYLTVPLLALTYYATAKVPPTFPAEYATTASVVLVGPEPANVRPDAAAGARNRLLQLGGSVATVARVVSLTLDEGHFREELDQAGLLGDFELTNEPGSPIIELRVIGTDPARVDATVAELVATVESELDATQDDLAVNVDERVEVRRISADNSPYAGLQSDRRAQAMLLVAGIILSIGMVVAGDAALHRLGQAVAPARRRTIAARATSPAPTRPSAPVPAADPTVVPAMTLSAPAPAARPTARDWQGLSVTVLFSGPRAREAARWVGGAAQAGGASVAVRPLDNMDLHELATADMVFVGAGARRSIPGLRASGAVQLTRRLPRLWSRRVAVFTTHRGRPRIGRRAAAELDQLVAAKSAEVVGTASLDQRRLPHGVPDFVQDALAMFTPSTVRPIVADGLDDGAAAPAERPAAALRTPITHR